MKKWFHTMTLGQPGKYVKLLLWVLFDSFVASIPSAVMLMAMYLFLMPVVMPGTPLQTKQLWILCGVLLVQFIGYNFVRQKSYMDFCTGFVETTKTSRIEMGEHLRKLSMGFFGNRDAGELSTVILRDYSDIEILAQQDVSAGILEYVGGIQTLKAFHMAGNHFATLKDSLNRQRKAAIGMETGAAAPVSMLGRCLLNCGIALVMYMGARFLMEGSLEPFYYIAFLVLTLTIYNPVLMLFTFIADFARTNRSRKRIEGLFEETPLPEPEKSLVPENMNISFEHVSFSYGEKEVLHDISLQFPEKSVTALVGHSGSGKSTITRLIARFWDAQSGNVCLGGVSLKNMKTDDLLRYVSMVFQDVYLFNDTIEGNIRMGKPDATCEEIVEAAKKAACHDFIMALPDGYNTVVGEGGSTLSGGEKQRISIARALLKDAPIVLLDEATASLDPENEVLIQQAISALVNEKTVIVIAHRLQSICNADQIIVLEDGRVRECGNHESLIELNGVYKKLWDEQNKAGSWQISFH